MQHVPQIRIFLASPGDVNEERAVALEVLDMLEYDPLFKRSGAGGVSIHAVAWDKPGGDTPMRATMTPQTAIKQGLPRPSACDIAIVLFWGRMGTPLPHPEYQKDDGSPYLSGTEWEYLDAVTGERANGKPITLIYRRTEEPHIDMKDRKAVAQYHAVLDFFDAFRDPKTGALIGGVNEYRSPEDLRQKLVNHLRVIVDGILTGSGTPSPDHLSSTALAPAMPAPRPLVEAPPLWEGSPFPGLRAFDEKDAPIFFGRGLETSELVKRLEASRFVGVVAASGSGKSSVVAAGLIPRLKTNAIVSGKTGSRGWRYVYLTPGSGDSPFDALFDGLCAAFPEHQVSPFSLPKERGDFVESIKVKPKTLIDICHALLAEANAPNWSEILFFVDQFEELFTVVKAEERTAFVALLEIIDTASRLRCIVTMRSDFYANCAELPTLAALLNNGNYVLSSPTAGALYEMITRPAERAGLIWDDGLPARVLSDTGSKAGALALMAYALDELYKISHAREDKRLPFDAYTALGGVAGAIGKRAETVFEALILPDKDRLLQRVFRELVVVDERGTATRQRAELGIFAADEVTLIYELAKARLVVTYDHLVEVAHEAVFRSWERLKNWIAEAQEDLILLRQVHSAAEEWAHKGQPDFLRWPAERLKLVYEMIQRQQPSLNEIERDFIEPEQARLLRELEKPQTDHERRRDIGDRLAVIGDTRPGVSVKDGTPDVVWLPVDVSTDPVTIKTDENEIGPITIPPFFIAKYQITYAQFQAFVAAEDGFEADLWWDRMPEKYKKQAVEGQRTKTANSPRDNVSWYQCVAFARWMNHRLRGLKLTYPGADKVLVVGENAQVRLPTEWEWQWAAQGGVEARAYPWGNWQTGYANTSKAGLSRTTAVGMYPHIVSRYQALDLAGNLFDWCQNEKADFNIIDGYSNGQSKVLRGGSFLNAPSSAACAFRYYASPQDGDNAYGVRVVVGSLLRGRS